jgi:hypothetical protein
LDRVDRGGVLARAWCIVAAVPTGDLGSHVDAINDDYQWAIKDITGP